MNVPLRWLGEHVDLSGIATADLVERLTLAGLEVTGVRLLGMPMPEGLRAKILDPGPVWERDKVVTAQVLRIEKHPNADKLKLVTLEYGVGSPKTVVTGAPNIAVGESGHKVILGLRGCRYFVEEEDKATKEKRKVIRTLEPKELRGIPNDAMCMSNFELGIADDHEGIILLEPDAPVGVPAVDFMGEIVLEIDVLPNMARCLAMAGIAREVAALFGRSVRPVSLPDWPSQVLDSGVEVEIVDARLCRRYVAVRLRDVVVQPSPGWLQRRLLQAGMRPINNIVDITNYVMLDRGQPLHAFDYDKLVQRAGGRKPRISIRLAKDGERLTTLDGQERVLTPDTLVIADTAGPIALAGVMGGLDTEVTAATSSILLESANFDPVSIRRTAHRLTLFSEASTRFSRGVHPELVGTAARAAAVMIADLGRGQIVGPPVDAYPAPLEIQEVHLPSAEIRRLLGIDFPPAEVERILTALEFQTQRVVDGWRVRVPQTRMDIQAGAADLIEELVRIHGYDRLPATLLSGELPPQQQNRELVLEERIRDLLANAGLQECITYSLTAREWERRLGLAEPWIELLNPISPERSVLRKSLLTNLLETAAQNLKHSPAVRLFEVGAVFVPTPDSRLPGEPRRLAVILAGRHRSDAWDAPAEAARHFDFFDLKGIVEYLLRSLHLVEPTWELARDCPHLHPARSARVRLGGEPVGELGELHPRTALAFGFADCPVLIADLALDTLIRLTPDRFAYRPVPLVQAALRDIAVVVDDHVPNDAVVREIRAAGGDLLAEVRLFDLYQGDSIPPGKKSLAYALTYQADRTLKDAEIDKAHRRIEDRLRHVLKAAIRGKD